MALTGSLSNANQTLTLVPSVPLRGNTLYTLTIASVADLSGHAMPTPVSCAPATT